MATVSETGAVCEKMITIEQYLVMKEKLKEKLENGEIDRDEYNDSHDRLVCLCEKSIAHKEKPIFEYKNNPMDDPKAAKDIVENPDAVYGYSPNPDSPRIGKYAHKIDWTDSKQVEVAKQSRLQYHENNQKMLDDLYSQGYSTEDIARKMVEERNTNRLNSYLERGDVEGYEIVRKSNLDTYGNANGPTPEAMLEKYGSWQDVTNASVRSNPGMDACVGLYDIYHGGN